MTDDINYRAARSLAQEIVNEGGDSYTEPYALATLTLAVLALVDSVDRVRDLLDMADESIRDALHRNP